MIAALFFGCGDDSEAVEETASATEGTGTGSTSGGQTLSTTVSASDTTVTASTTSESDTAEDSTSGDTTGDSVDDSTGGETGDTDGELCGNGQIDAGEVCDGQNLGRADCEALGFAGGGTLSCTDDCTFDITQCVHGGDCCEANGSPACDDVTCQAVVCDTNPSCCETEWNQACADLANTSCPICDGLGEGDCCSSNDSPGCADLTCQQIVCASNPGCCSGNWTQACATAAGESCVVCDGGGSGSCCEANNSAGCDDLTCQQIVCAFDPFCCSDEWDALCGFWGSNFCVVCDGGGTGSCCETQNTPGCADTTCQQIVCSTDPFCCSTAWDQLCVDAAEDSCVVCGGGGSGSCCTNNGTPGCDDITCQQIVCSADPFCCNTAWDQLCADAANDDCVVCGGGGSGDCCANNNTPGCDDVTCQQIVCANDPFCCNIAWDQLCADQAADECVVCGGGGDGDCCTNNGTPGCQNGNCEQIVCAIDPFCCATAWDQLCANQAGDFCAVCGGGGTGNCCASNGTPGCANADCEGAVCPSDPFCCTTAWDNLCAAAANNTCTVCQ